MASIINKLRSFSEWHDMDDRLSRPVAESIRKRESFISSQGHSFRSFLDIQPDSVQPSLLRAHSLLKRTEDAVKIADEAVPSLRNSLSQLRPLYDDIKQKRKVTQALRDRAAKSSKKADSAASKLDVLQTKNPASPEVTRLRDEADRAASQKQADAEAVRQREAQLVGEEVEYKKKLFIAVLNALDDFTAAKGSSAEALVPIGEDLDKAGAEIPFVGDPLLDNLRLQLAQLEKEPLDD
jgi:DNA repair ATPase RecN